MTETPIPAPLATWAVVEVFGRTKAAGFLTEIKAAGFLTEIKAAGKDFFRLDIPAVNGYQARTINYSPEALFDWEPVDEETARLVAAHDRPPEPVSVWSARTMVRASGNQLALETPADVLEEEDDDPEDPL